MTSLVIQSLHPNYIYHITVSAHTVATGPPSTLQIIQLPEDGKHTLKLNIILLLCCDTAVIVVYVVAI